VIEGKIKIGPAANKSCSKKRPEEVLFGLRFSAVGAILFGMKALIIALLFIFKLFMLYKINIALTHIATMQFDYLLLESLVQ